jgi:hypothetical protein
LDYLGGPYDEFGEEDSLQVEEYAYNYRDD